MTAVTRMPTPAERAVERVLAWPGFDDHRDRFAFFADEDGRIDFEAVLADWLWSGGEHVALRCAQALQDDLDFPRSDLLARLDYDLLVRVLAAQRLAVGLPPAHDAAGCDRCREVAS